METDWRWHQIQFKFQEYRIIETFELFRKHNIEPVLIKGWAAARNYPMKEERVFTDTDICVAPADFRTALKVLDASRGQKILVDLHEGLRHLDTLEWDDLFANTVLIRLGETDIRLLRAEDHLRVLCVHWLNDGGAHRERLRDILYAVENRPADFDWDRCLNTVSAKRRKWVVCAIGLAHKYLNLSLENTPIAEEAESIPGWMSKAVEREWGDEYRLKPLRDSLSDRREFFRQIKKRFPPNPIQATIETGGAMDDTPRIFYQLGDIFFRAKPAVKNFCKTFLKRR